MKSSFRDLGEEYDRLSGKALADRDWEPFRAAVRDLAGSIDRAKEVYDAIGLETAERFLDGRMSFEDADWVANQLYSAMLADGVEYGFEKYAFAKLAFKIFEAFDAGEWHRHGEDGDPAELYTRPFLQRILTEHLSKNGD